MENQDYIFLTGLRISCIIGIFDWERRQKQDVVLDLRFPANIRKASLNDHINDAVDYKRISKAAIAFVEKSRFQLVETLAERLTAYLLVNFQLPELFIRLSKPEAIRGSKDVGVEITRTRTALANGLVYLSLGSNLEPTLHLKNALAAIDHQFGLARISHIYETSPVGGKKGQPFFWNMVVAVDTNEKPGEIRQWISRLEKKEGRLRTRDRYRSRTLDVDMLVWKNLIHKNKSYTLPHPDISAKAFVLFPLLEIAPNFVIPGTDKTMVELAHAFRDKRQSIRQLKNLPPSTFKTWPVTNS